MGGSFSGVKYINIHDDAGLLALSFLTKKVLFR